MASPHPTRAQEPTASPPPPPRAVESKIAQAFSFEALKKRSPWFAVPWDVRVKELKTFATIGALASVMVGSAMCYADGNPKTTLRGVLKREAPRLALRGAVFGTLLQLSVNGIEIVSGHHGPSAQRTYIALPIAAALLEAPKGLKAALTAAKGSIGMAVLLSVSAMAPEFYHRVKYPEQYAPDAPLCGCEDSGNARDPK